MKRFSRFPVTISVSALALLFGCGPGSGKNPVIKGVIGPVVSVSAESVVLNEVFAEVKLEADIEVPVPGFPSSVVKLSTEPESGGTLVSLNVNIQDYLASQGAGLPLQTLPGGRSIPGVTSGSLPAEAIVIPQFGESRLFVSPKALGFFISSDKLKAAPNSIRTYRFYDQQKNPVGMIALVGAPPAGGLPGLLVLMSPDLLGIRGPAARAAFLRALSEQGIR